MDVVEKIDKRLDEAEKVKFEDLPLSAQGVLRMMGVKPERVDSFSGIHGDVVMFKDSMPFRLHKKDFNKLKSKDIRWIDISSVGL